MKKLFSLLSCLICATLLAATGFAATTTDAYSIYKKAADSLSNATSIEMSGTTKTDMEADSEKLGTSTQTTTIKMVGLDGNKLQMEMHTKDSDTKQTIDMYYKDGYMYTNDGSKKTKMKLDIESATSSAGAFDTSFSKDLFKDATVEKTDNGTRIKFKMKFSDLKNEDGKALVDEISDSLPGSKIKVGDITYSMLIGSDNKLKSYSMAFSMTVDYQGMTFKTKTTATYKIVSVNKISKVNLPADLSSYKQA